ncbi:MAG: biopolymer transporter ExbD [Burkholderiales bacterium]|nr:MAG: biopolymer transporter ExbD [Burkholderiales bacterium]
MVMSVGPPNGASEENFASEINTTPLVDVMLVLLIIFLITIPVVITSIPVELPKEVNQPRQTKPENITLSVNRDGDIYWNDLLVPGMEALVERLKKVSVLDPQPEVHVRGDAAARYESVGKIVFACQRAGIVRISFVTEPPARGGQ